MNLSRKEKINKFSHLLAGAIILIHGCERLGDGHTLSAILFLTAGVIFLGVAFFHHKLVGYIRSADAIFTFIEGLLAVVIAFEFIHAHKHYIQYMYIFAALLYFTRSIFLFSSKPSHSTH